MQPTRDPCASGRGVRRRGIVAILTFTALGLTGMPGMAPGFAALAADGLAGKPAPAADWPNWRGPDGSGVGVGSGKPLVADLADMRLVWRSEERGIPANAWHNGTQGGYDSPIVANDKVFIGYFKGTGDILDPDVLKSGDSKSAGAERARWNAAVATEDIVLCLDAKTGKTLWKKVLGEGVNLFQRRKGGPHQGVCWYQNRVYAQDTMGRVYCLKEDTGEIIWKADVPATAKNLKVLEAYKKIGRQHPYRGVEPPELKACGLPRLFMYPLCVADGVVVADGGAFYATTGKPVAWPKPPGTNGDRNSTCPLRWVCAGKEYFIIGNACIAPKTGQVVWQIKESGGGTPTLGGGYLVTRGGGKDGGFLGCTIDANGYKVVWSNKDYSPAGHMASIGIIHNGWFFAEVHTAGGREKMPSGATELAIGIELATGKVVGPAAFEGVSQTLCTSLVGMDGRWFFHVGAGYSGMVMMNASGTDFKQVGLRMPTVKSHLPLPGGTKAKDKLDFCLTSTPAMVGGLMYFRGSDCLWCYDLRAK